MSDLADDITRQQRTLFGHLPDGEVSDDEPLEFRTDEHGRLMVRTAEAVYRLENGVTWRYRPVDEGEELTTWKDGHLRGRVIIPEHPESN